jgi:predicted N-acetyltransferase YhbS
MNGSDWDSLSIRNFHYPDDYDKVLALWKSAGQGLHVRRSDEPGEIQKKLQRDPDLFLLAEQEGQVVGLFWEASMDAEAWSTIWLYRGNTACAALGML